MPTGRETQPALIDLLEAHPGISTRAQLIPIALELFENHALDLDNPLHDEGLSVLLSTYKPTIKLSALRDPKWRETCLDMLGMQIYLKDQSETNDPRGRGLFRAHSIRDKDSHTIDPNRAHLIIHIFLPSLEKTCFVVSVTRQEDSQLKCKINPPAASAIQPQRATYDSIEGMLQDVYTKTIQMAAVSAGMPAPRASSVANVFGAGSSEPTISGTTIVIKVAGEETALDLSEFSSGADAVRHLNELRQSGLLPTESWTKALIAINRVWPEATEGDGAAGGGGGEAADESTTGTTRVLFEECQEYGGDDPMWRLGYGDESSMINLMSYDSEAQLISDLTGLLSHWGVSATSNASAQEALHLARIVFATVEQDSDPSPGA